MTSSCNDDTQHDDKKAVAVESLCLARIPGMTAEVIHVALNFSDNTKANGDFYRVGLSTELEVAL